MAASNEFERVSILGTDSIVIGHELWGSFIAEDLLLNVRSSTYVLVTDDHLEPLYVEPFVKAFAAARTKLNVQARLLTFSIAPGETSKSRAVKSQIEDWMLHEARNPPCDTKTVIIALGGGVVGDLSGFVAATFKRGIRFVQVPTSVLAMVDSSVGGKTAIDTTSGKNLIGAFWQPSRIYVNLSFLDTLPPRQFINGMAEVIKTAAIWDSAAFEFLERHRDAVMASVQSKPIDGRRNLSGIKQILQQVVAGSIKVKAEVVTSDEREGGLRNLLNFGHSIGHAIEAILAPQILHGECVAVGMHLEALLARYLGVLSESAVARLKKLIVAYGLPTSIEDPKIKSLSAGKHCAVDQLLTVMAVDKKNEGTQKRIVLLHGIGKTYERRATPVEDRDIRFILSPNVKVTRALEAVPDIACTPPGSKSVSNRSLVLAALSKGTCRIRNLLHSDDTEVMMNALTEMKAASFSWENNGQTLVVTGTGGLPKASSKPLYLGNAGTASRFLTSVATLATDEVEPFSVLTGNARMKQRPIGPLVDALEDNGAEIAYVKQTDRDEYVDKSSGERNDKYGRCLPLRIRAGGGMEGGEIRLAAGESSQYVSSILMCAPRAKKPVTLRMVGGPPISQPYIDMTAAMMASFGIHIRKSETEEHTYHIPQGVYQSPATYEVESDASSATYPLAIAAITGTSCTVPNIGHASLQGDARFAAEILKPMGCTVVQTPTSTKVTGPPPGQLKPVAEVDMTTMTDAFLTASVLAAVAQGSSGGHWTRITGIANQQKKECERISVMRDQLARFGVKARLWPSEGSNVDGIEVEGVKLDALQDPLGGVHCWDDHRVAMSFSVLATAMHQGAVVQEKDCTGKTWPSWWDTLRNLFQFRLQGVDAPVNQLQAQKQGPRGIFLIGMRGAGKTTVGKWAADVLQWPFTDLDELLELEHKQSIPDMIKTHGWDAFRKNESDLLAKAIHQAASEEGLYACGGGVVELPEARQLFSQFKSQGGTVLLVERNIDDVIAFLQQDKTRPAYVDDMRAVWERRKEWYLQCSNFQYYGQQQHLNNSTTVPPSLRQMLHNIVHGNEKAEALLSKSPSFFLSLTLPDLDAAPRQLKYASDDVDAVELRVDLLLEYSREYVAKQLAICRTLTSRPIIFTVRTCSEGGKFDVSSTQGEVAMLELLELGLRSGVEFLDLEIRLPSHIIDFVQQNKRSTKIIASRHDTQGVLRWDRDWPYQYERAVQIGDIVKLIGSAKIQRDNVELETFRQWASGQSQIPLVALNMGTNGPISRIMNPILTPVTHECLPQKAAPGQLSAQAIRTALGLHGVLLPLNFYIFGKPVSGSPSPTLHNGLFKLWGFPYHYQRLETNSARDVVNTISSADFGGASVTIPLKLDIIPLLDAITEEACVIGAVNTIVVDRKRRSNKQDGHYLTGHNTDWQGIRCVLQYAGARASGESALVIGTGGTSRAAIFALHKMGYAPIYVAGRSQQKCADLAASFPAHFGTRPVTGAEDISGGYKLGAAIGTIPGSQPVDEGLLALLNQILQPKSMANGTGSVEKPRIFVEMAYIPDPTPLTSVMSQHGWTCVPGRDVLAGQGCFQAQLWTSYLPSFDVALDLVKSHRASI